MDLAELGLTSAQEEVYRGLLRGTGGVVTGLGEADADAALAGLVELGLVGADRVPVPPAAAIDLLIRRRIDSTTRELQRLGSAWDLVEELSSLAPGRPASEVVERVDGLETVNQRVQAVRAKDEVLAMKEKPEVTSRPAHVRDFRARLAAGLTGRTIVAAASLDDLGQRDFARAQHRLGDLHRSTTGPFQPMVILDRRIAFIRSDPRTSDSALVIRQPGAVATLVELFEVTWRHATELDDTALTTVQRQVLSALSAHTKDDVAARSLHISVRKYRGAVAELMDRVGASNRFQLALRAKENNWL